jgi:hypothetical protein
MTRYWQGISDWPRPDIAFEDPTTGASLALEFKPPGQSKREYVTGIGQAFTYLRDFEYAAVILPRKTVDAFEIAEYFQASLNDSFAQHIPIALFAYERDPTKDDDLTALVSLRIRAGEPPPIPKGVGRKVFWAYWRDLSQYDVFDILCEIDRVNRRTFNSAYRQFWKRKMVAGRALTWEGLRRKRKSLNAPSYESEKTNVQLSLRHTGILSPKGALTDEGLQLLRYGKVYGPSSKSFMDYLSHLVLQTGRHLELIFWVDEQQRELSQNSRRNAPTFYHGLDLRLERAGIITAAPTDRPKPTFLRDEQKLWNKLGLLVPSHGRSYFHPGVGLVFNWRAIISAAGE